MKVEHIKIAKPNYAAAVIVFLVSAVLIYLVLCGLFVTFAKPEIPTPNRNGIVVLSMFFTLLIGEACADLLTYDKIEHREVKP